MKREIIIIFFLIFCYACEYQTEDIHFVEKERPTIDKKIEIDLYGVKDNDTIYIYSKTRLSYSIHEELDKILKKEITLDGVLLENNYNGILVEPEVYDNSIHKLKLYVESTSGTESIAEKLGLEKHFGEKEYTLKYVHVDKGLKITDGLSDKDYLKIQWQKPNIEGVEVDKYIVSYDKDWTWNSEISDTITDPNLTYLIDENYTHGYKNYRIQTFFKNNKIGSWNDMYAMSYSSLGGEKINFAITGLQSGSITWTKNKYRCKYVLDFELDENWNTKTETLEYSLTSKNFSLPPFPEDISGNIYVLPESFEGNNWTMGKNYFYYNHTSLPGDRYKRSCITNTKHNLLYAFSGYFIAQYDLNSKENINEIYIDYIDYFDDDKLSCSSQTGNVAALQTYGSTIHIFDQNLNELNKFEINRNTIYNSTDDVFSITDNDQIIVSGMSYSRVCMVYNIKGELLYNITLPTSPYRTKITSSADGKYVCIYTGSNIKIYELGEQQAVLYKDINTSSVVNCYFDPIFNKKLIIQESDYFYIQNIETLNKTKSIEGTYISTDPYTGYIMYYDINFDTNKMGHIRKDITDDLSYNFLLSTFHSQSLIGNTYIFNNTLVTNNPYWDISKYLK